MWINVGLRSCLHLLYVDKLFSSMRACAQNLIAEASEHTNDMAFKRGLCSGFRIVLYGLVARPWKQELPRIRSDTQVRFLKGNTRTSMNSVGFWSILLRRQHCSELYHGQLP